MFSKKLRPACVAAGFALVALVGVMPAAADAGTFTIHSCKLPDGSPAATGGWTKQTAAAGFHQADTCVAGESLRTEMEGLGMPVGSQRLWRWAAATDTQLQAVELYRSFTLAAGDTGATPTMTIDAGPQRIEQNGSSLPSGNGIASGGTLSPWNHATNRLSVADPASLAANEITLKLSCTGRAGASCPDTGTAGSELHLLAARFTLLDALSPSITAVGGSLTRGGDKSGTQTLRFSATDAGAGIYRTFLDVDGTTVATSTPDPNTGRCADAVPANTDPYEFQDAQPCPLAVTDVDVPLDTRTIADGAHTVQLRVEDAAGNQTSAYGPTTMVVRNTPTPVTPTPVTPTPVQPGTGTPTTGRGSPATGTTGAAAGINGVGGGPGARVSVVVLRSNQRSVRVSYGKTVTVSGRVTTPAGDPVAGADVEVLSQTRLRGAKLTRVATVHTDRSGAFRYTVAKGPSRLIRFGYRANSADATFSHTTDIDVRVQGQVSLRLSRPRLRNGQTLRYTGTVAGVGARRPLVQIQVRDRGRWVNVCVVRTKAGGAYACSYHFRRTFSPTTYTFRAVVRKQEGLPYETDASPRRAVRVRP
jgi:hypothetical protein